MTPTEPARSSLFLSLSRVGRLTLVLEMMRGVYDDDAGERGLPMITPWEAHIALETADVADEWETSRV